MNRKPKQTYDYSLRKAVLEYHEWHRDSHVELKGFVCDERGEPMILTRVIDEHGKPYSVLLEFYWDAVYARWDIKEYTGTPRKNEFDILQEYMGGGVEDDP